MADQIKDIPDKFGGFIKLQRVEVNARYYWGDYSILNVGWFVKNNQFVARWNESTLCVSPSQRCFVSKLLLDGTEESSLFSSSVNLVEKQILSNPRTYRDRINYFPANGKKTNPLSLELDISWFSPPVVLKGGGASAGKAENIVKKYVSALRAGSDTPEKRASINSKNFANFSPATLQSVYSHSDAKAMFFTSDSFATMLRDSKEIVFYGVIKGDSEYYLISRVNTVNGMYSIVFPCDLSSSNILQQPKNEFMSLLFRTSSFYSYISNHVNQKQKGSP